MPNYKVKIKHHSEMKEFDLVARDIDAAQQRVLSENPTCEIINIEQKGAGGSVPAPAESAAPVKTSGGSLGRKLVLLIIIATIAVAGYFVLKSKGII